MARQEGILVGLTMLSIWAVGFIAVGTLTAPFWKQVEHFIGGQTGGNNGGA